MLSWKWFCERFWARMWDWQDNKKHRKKGSVETVTTLMDWVPRKSGRKNGYAIRKSYSHWLSWLLLSFLFKWLYYFDKEAAVFEMLQFEKKLWTSKSRTRTTICVLANLGLKLCWHFAWFFLWSVRTNFHAICVVLIRLSCSAQFFLRCVLVRRLL